eukprot:SAG22_NODE_328_length_12271_cov_9.681811_5_plen_317_part_00
MQMQVHWTAHPLSVQSPSMHVPPFWQGLLSHSAIAEQSVPLLEASHPGLHRHSCVPGPVWTHSPRTLSHSSSPREQTSTIVAQSLIPAYPFTQAHMKASTWSVHVPPFRHATEAQSSILVWQLLPSYPQLQLQLYSSGRMCEKMFDSKQIASCRHGADQHSSMSLSQFSPAQPLTQVHEYLPTSSVQLPLFWHGLLSNSSTSASHTVPLCPAAQPHANASAGTAPSDDDDSLQVPPFWHGLLSHSSTSASHTVPLCPAAQSHATASAGTTPSDDDDSLQVPPFWHGLLSHSSSSADSASGSTSGSTSLPGSGSGCG